MSDRSPYDLSNGPRLRDPARPARHDKTSEELRRLARYDEAVEILEMVKEWGVLPKEPAAILEAFLAAEPKPDAGREGK